MPLYTIPAKRPIAPWARTWNKNGEPCYPLRMHTCPECGQACYCGGDIDDIDANPSDYPLFCHHECQVDEDANDFYEDEDEDADYCDRCGNEGIIPCRCGGDFCICMNHGEAPCPDCDHGY